MPADRCFWLKLELAQTGAIYPVNSKGFAGADRASRAIYESVLEATASGTKTVDLGGHSTTSEFTDDVIKRIATKIEVWSTLGSR